MSFDVTVPTITPNPASGPFGISVTLTGSGFADSVPVTVDYASTPISTSPSPCKSSGSGAISCSFTVQGGLGGSNVISATDTYNNVAYSQFMVTQPIIELSPSSGPLGTTVSITGSGFAPSVTVTVSYGGAKVATGTSTSSGAFQATFSVPASAQSQSVTAVDSDGNTASEYFAVTVPSVSASPTSGAVGTQVTLTGSGFAPSSSVTVTFDTTKLSTSCTSSGSGDLSCTFTVPTSGTGSQTVTVTDSYGNAATALFLVTAPALSLNPTSGPVGTLVTATSNGFPASTSVSISFSGAVLSTSPSTCVTSSSGALNCIFAVPSSPAGQKIVIATDSFGGAANATFTITTPTLSLSIYSGIVGQSVTISGSGYLASSTITLFYDGTSFTASIPETNAQGDFQGTLLIPPSSAGPHVITATDAAGNSISQTFTVKPSASIAPTAGFVGTTVIALGSGFTASASINIAFNGTAVSTSPSPCIVSSAGAFTCSFAVPASAEAGNATVAITDSASDSVQKEFVVDTVTFTLNLLRGQGAMSLSSSNVFTITYTQDGAPANLTLGGGSASIQADLQTIVKISAASSESGSTEEWCLQISGGACQSVSIITGSTLRSATYYYYDLLPQSVSCSSKGGSLPSQPMLTYMTAPSAASSTGSQQGANASLSGASQTLWALRGSELSITPIVSGSTEMRWATATQSFSVSASSALTIEYYLQYSRDISYSVTGQGSPQNATLSYSSFGETMDLTLGQAGQVFWIDSGTNATVSNTLGGSNSTERWFAPITYLTVTGTNGTPLTFPYLQQFQLTISAQPAAGGFVAPANEWVDADVSITINATRYAGWSFQGWTGTGKGSYSGPNQSSAIEMTGPIAETAAFYPGLDLRASPGGHVSYSYQSARGVVKPGTNGTIYLPSATIITLTETPASIFYIFKGWTGGVNSTSGLVSITTSSPMTERATFGYNLFLFGIFGASGLTAPPLAASLLGGRRQRYRVGQVVWYNNSPWIVTSFSKGKRGKFYNLRTTRSQSGSQPQ